MPAMTTRRALLVGLGGTLLGARADETPARLPAVLQQPALRGPKALQAGMLAITRAGARLVAVGERGIVLTSDDAGRRWQQAEVPVQVTLTQVRFVDAQHGWAVGHLGVVLRSDDGGRRWTKVLDGVQAARLLAEADPAAQALVTDGPDKPFFDVLPQGPDRALVVGAYELMLATGDGGRSWQAAPQRLDTSRGLHLYGALAVGDVQYLAGEQGRVLRSRDGGAHFETVTVPYKGSFFGLLASGDGALIAYGLRGQAWRTEDGGTTWARAETGVGAGLSAGLARGDGSLVLLSQNGEVLVSRDGGRRFEQRAALPMPAAGLAEAAPGTLVLAGLRGLRTLPLPTA